MANLYIIKTKNESEKTQRSSQEKIAILYHDLFDYPLSFSDLVKWTPHESLSKHADKEVLIVSKRGYSYLKGRDGLIYKRILRNRVSDKKFEIAKKASKLLSLVPTVKMVAVTGSLAMQNASDESDIDLMIVTKKGFLWTTRLLSYLVLKIMNYDIRRPNDKNQKDKLCLNMWLDEGNLVWNDRNIYSAHEIAQIVPLFNKNRTYENFLFKNKWILSYWPNAVRIKKKAEKDIKSISVGSIANAIEKFVFKFQYQHMKPKITREVVSKNRALFHPHDWGKVVLGRLKNYN